MKPLTRKEFFMAKAAGQTVPDIEPITREEYFLNQIAESGGGGGGGGVVCDLTSEIIEDAPVITATMTAGELWSAIQNGSSLLFHFESESESTEMFTPLQMAGFDQNGYTFSINVGVQPFVLAAGNADDYPSSDGGGK